MPGFGAAASFPIRVAGIAAFVTLASCGAAAPGASAGFGPERVLSDHPNGHALGVLTRRSLVADLDHNLHLFYYEFGPNTNPERGAAVYYRRFNSLGSSWEDEQVIQQYEAPDPETLLPRIYFPSERGGLIAAGTDCAGNVHTAWSTLHMFPGPSVVARLSYCRRDPVSGWGPVQVLRETAVPLEHGPFSFNLAVNLRGDVCVAWIEPFGSGSALQRLFRPSEDPAWDAPSTIVSYPEALSSDVLTVAVDRFPSDRLFHVFWAAPNGQLLRSTLEYEFGIANTHPIALGIPGPVNGALGAGVTYCGDVDLFFQMAGGEPRRMRVEVTNAGAGIPATIETVPAPDEPIGGAHSADGLGNIWNASNDGLRVWLREPEVWAGDIPFSWSMPRAASFANQILADGRGGLHVADVLVDSQGWGQVVIQSDPCIARPPPPVPAPDAARLSPGLARRIAVLPGRERIPVIVHSRDRIDRGELSKAIARIAPASRRDALVARLRDQALRSQQPLRSELERAQASGAMSGVRPLWIVNAIGAEMVSADIQRIARRSDVVYVGLDDEVFVEASPSLGQASSSLGPSWPSPGARTASSSAWGVEHIGAPAVWAQGFRGQCVVVGIVDTGGDHTHPDLASRIWHNAGEVAENGLDDDGNGFVDDVAGWDFASGGVATSDNDPTDEYSESYHGTHVAGIVAGTGASGLVTGVAPAAQVMAIKIFRGSGSTSLTRVAGGVEYGIQNGAHVINLSFGRVCGDDSARSAYREMLEVARNAGVVVCVAAGNDRCVVRPPNAISIPGDVPPPWISPDQPATGAVGGATTVGATATPLDLLASFSNVGPVDWSQVQGYADWQICDASSPHVGLIKPDLCAPGQAIPSCRPLAAGGPYAFLSGTSMAAPHVAGLVALMLSKNTGLMPEQSHAILESTALDLGRAGKDNQFGAGRIVAPLAVAMVPDRPRPPLAIALAGILDTVGVSNRNGVLEGGETADLAVIVENTDTRAWANVTAELAADPAWIEVLSGNSWFGEIPPGGSAVNRLPLRVSVSPKAPAGTIVNFVLSLSPNDEKCAMLASVSDTLGPPLSHVQNVGLLLAPPAPNPVRADALLSFAVESSPQVRMVVLDVSGRLRRVLVDGVVPAGRHSFRWDATDDRGVRLEPGIYAILLSGVGQAQSRRVVILGH